MCSRWLASFAAPIDRMSSRWLAGIRRTIAPPNLWPGGWSPSSRCFHHRRATAPAIDQHSPTQDPQIVCCRLAHATPTRLGQSAAAMAHTRPKALN